MAFERLLWGCLDHGTSISEEGLALAIDRRSGETILLFQTDSAAFRTSFYAAGSPQIACDALFFYKPGTERPVLIFVELKGANLPHALDQLKATILAVKPHVERAVPGSTRYLALVVSDGARPTTRKEKQREFEAATKVTVRVHSTARGKKAVDLRDVLQREGLAAR
ncbi:MAG: hypothetical protein IPF92_30740 [Myxococcales bacterium]|nr:hypothetical protein [Myxococcales bacterium]